MLFVCDSIGKYIEETENLKVAVFPGETTEKVKNRLYTGELDRHLENTWCVCLAVGTNNIEKDTPFQIVQNLISILQMLRGYSRDKVVAVCAIIPRVDEIPRQAKIPIVNKWLL